MGVFVRKGTNFPGALRQRLDGSRWAVLLVWWKEDQPQPSPHPLFECEDVSASSCACSINNGTGNLHYFSPSALERQETWLRSVYWENATPVHPGPGVKAVYWKYGRNSPRVNKIGGRAQTRRANARSPRKEARRRAVPRLPPAKMGISGVAASSRCAVFMFDFVWGARLPALAPAPWLFGPFALPEAGRPPLGGLPPAGHLGVPRCCLRPRPVWSPARGPPGASGWAEAAAESDQVVNRRSGTAGRGRRPCRAGSARGDSGRTGTRWSHGFPASRHPVPRARSCRCARLWRRAYPGMIRWTRQCWERRGVRKLVAGPLCLLGPAVPRMLGDYPWGKGAGGAVKLGPRGRKLAALFTGSVPFSAVLQAVASGLLTRRRWYAVYNHPAANYKIWPVNLPWMLLSWLVPWKWHQRKKCKWTLKRRKFRCERKLPVPNMKAAHSKSVLCFIAPIQWTSGPIWVLLIYVIYLRYIFFQKVALQAEMEWNHQPMTIHAAKHKPLPLL